MAHYDILVISTGPAGMMAAIRSARAGKKTLLISPVDNPGGLWGAKRLGRFQFDLRPVVLYEGADDRAVRLMQEAGVWQEKLWEQKSPSLRLTCREGGPDENIPAGLSAYCDRLCSICPGSRESLRKLFALSEETESAVKLLREDSRSGCFNLLLSHPNFMKVVGRTVDSVLKSLEVPELAGHLVKSGLYGYGGDVGQMSFAAFAPAFLAHHRAGSRVPVGTAYSLMLSLEKAMREAGVEVWYNCPVKSLTLEEGRVTGAELENGYTITAGAVAADADPADVVGSWLPEASLESLKAVSAIGRGAQGFTLLLGLKKSPLALGIRQDRIQLQSSADPAKDLAARSGLDTVGGCLVTAQPAGDEENKGGLLTMSVLFTQDAFADVGPAEYESAKQRLAEKLITGFEKSMSVKLRPSIEEALTIGPAEYALMGAGPEGQVVRQNLSGWHSPWLAAPKAEVNPAEGLYICAGGSRSADFADAVISGCDAADLAMAGGKGGRA